jgi:hypothetical protein
MTQIGYNIHAQRVTDSVRLKNHLVKLQSSAFLTLDGLGLAQDLHKLLPNAVVIHRNYGLTKGDEDLHKRISPQQWLDLRGKEGDGGVWLYLENEPGFSPEMLDWTARMMELCIPRGIKLVVGNWSVGTPDPDHDWPKAKQVLTLASQHRDLFIIGLHEYGGGVMTSGITGGAPDGTVLNKDGSTSIVHQNYIPRDAWPEHTDTLTLFHCGRFRFLASYCQNNGLKPRAILTEHGVDDVSDIGWWLKRLKVNQGYSNARGWKTLQSQWNDWYRTLGWSAQRAYFEMVKWADQAIYKDSMVEAQILYCWAHSSQDWEQFDLAEASEFQSLLEAYAQQGVVTVHTPTIVEINTSSTQKPPDQPQTNSSSGAKPPDQHDEKPAGIIPDKKLDGNDNLPSKDTVLVETLPTPSKAAITAKLQAILLAQQTLEDEIRELITLLAG